MKSLSDEFWGGVAVVILLLLGFGAAALVSHWIYGDWTCAFARCVKVKP